MNGKFKKKKKKKELVPLGIDVDFRREKEDGGEDAKRAHEKQRGRH